MNDVGRAVPDHASGPVLAASSYDVCECGDYRHQHDGGEGRCMLGSLCQPARCLKFRLFREGDCSAQAIEARRAETGTGSVGDESAVHEVDAPGDQQ